jgi:bifunctional non-homologous end joining protein LigD
VPRGPTLAPGVRRSAFHVEDHPLEYFDFEGVIPAGQYGGGDVIVWDAGTWEPTVDDPGRAVAAGELHFDIYGEKLRGRFAIVRTRTDASGKEQWLLLHKRDEHAVDGWDPEDHPHVGADRPYERRGQGGSGPVVALGPAGGPGRRDGEIPARHGGRTAALDALPRPAVAIFGRELRVTNLDKVLFPARPGEEPVTKRDLLRYTAQIAPTLLPYLTRRALNLHRYPDGAQAKGSGRRNCPTTRRSGCRAGTTRTPTRARPVRISSWTSRPH